MEIGLQPFNIHLHQVKKEKKQQQVMEIPFYEKSIENPGRQIKQEKKLLHVMEKPFYEKYISKHEHQIEGLYFVDIERDTLSGGVFDEKEKETLPILKYSDLFLLRNIDVNKSTNVEKSTVTNIKNNLFKIELSDDESRFFELINLSSKSSTNTKPKNFSLTVERKPKLESTNVSTSSGGKYKSLKKRKARNISKKMSGGIFKISQLGKTIIYKYQDPVIRMICEYIKLWDNYFKEDKTRFVPMRTADNEINEAVFTTQLNLFLKGKGEAGAEGSVCRFGIGVISCCNDIRRSFDQLSIKLDDFHLEDYILATKTDNYIKQLKTTNEMGYIFKPAVGFLKKADIDKILYTKILQKTIDAIIKKSGRVEGPPNVGEEPIADQRKKMYPPVNLLELLDKENDTWLIRCERFHLSLSPCVHLGIEGLGRVDNLLAYLNLVSYVERLKFENIAWLHTIGHALDRLYCGHTHRNNKFKDNAAILKQILKSFELFYLNMGRPTLLGIFSNALPEINILFYYILIKDIDELTKYVQSAPEDKINIMVDSAQKLPLKMLFSGATLESKKKILIRKIRESLLVTHYFNKSFSYTIKDDEYVQRGCDIKKEYGCKSVVKKDEIAFLQNQLDAFNP